VVKLTGHIFNRPIDLPRLRGIASAIREASRSQGICVVVGGGSLARDCISEAARVAERRSEYILDQIGILATRINAATLKLAIGDEAYLHLGGVDELPAIMSVHRICVMGGFAPGFSTNAVSALAAEALGAGELVNVTRAGGVYDRDPERHSDARLIRRISVDELAAILSEWERAGHYPLFDRASLAIIKRAGIRVRVVPPEPEAVKMALEGRDVGSLVTP